MPHCGTIELLQCVTCSLFSGGVSGYWNENPLNIKRVWLCFFKSVFVLPLPFPDPARVPGRSAYARGFPLSLFTRFSTYLHYWSQGFSWRARRFHKTGVTKTGRKIMGITMAFSLNWPLRGRYASLNRNWLPVRRLTAAPQLSTAGHNGFKRRFILARVS